MNKYLVKIATSSDREKSSWNGLGNSLAGSIAGGILTIPITLAGVSLGQLTSSKINKPDPEIADKYTVKKFLKDNDLKGKIKFQHGPNPAYLDKNIVAKLPLRVQEALGVNAKKHVIMGVKGNGINHAITMHELGHAKDFNTGLTKLKKSTGLRIGIKGGSGVATFAMLSNEKTQDYAVVPAMMPGIMHLREEGAANYHAYKGIKAHKGAPAANKFLKTLVPAQMGNYALTLGAPVVGAAIASKVIKSLKKEEK